MTVTLGDTTLPGVQTTVESSRSVAVSTGAPGDVGIVGEADLGSDTSQGNANPNQVYRITTPVGARNKFGAGSLLTNAIVDAMNMGAYPVYAIAAETTSVSAEDISSISSTSGTLTDAPVVDDPAETTFTVDSSDKQTVITYDDPATKTPADGEVYVNPVTGEFELDAAPSSSGSVDYTGYDYTPAFSTLREQEADTVDFVTALSENSDVVSGLQGMITQMQNQYNFAIGIAGVGSYVTPSEYSNPFEDSRMQLMYPTRTSAGDSILGSVVGIRAALGANGSLMRRTLGGTVNLRETLSKTQKEDLDAANVIPVANEASGASILTDSTCIDTGDMQDGLSRIIVDYVTEIVYNISDQFIGQLHTQGKRNAMESMISDALGGLQEQDSIEQYTVVVEEEDAYTANVQVSVETIKALRNVIANVTSGELAE